MQLEEKTKNLIEEYLDFMAMKYDSIEERERPTEEFYQRYQSVYPDFMFYYWQRLGFACFDEGGWWLVNPADYTELLDLILADTPFLAHDEFYVIGRNAFGNLTAIGTQTRSSLTIDMRFQQIYPSLSHERHNSNYRLAIWASIKLSYPLSAHYKKKGIKVYDEMDEQGNYLYQRCLASLGKLSKDEMYGYEPVLALGGKNQLSYMKKVNIFSYINFVAQLEPFRIMMDINAVADSMGITSQNTQGNDTERQLKIYDESIVLGEDEEVMVSGYYQDSQTRKVMYFEVGDKTPIYPSNAQGVRSQAYVWHKLTETGVSQLSEEERNKAKKS